MIALFSLRLLFGMSLMWALMPRSQVSSGFFRIQMLVALGLSVLAALTVGEFLPGGEAVRPLISPQAAAWLCGGLGTAAFLGSITWTLERRGAGTFFVMSIAAASGAVLLLLATSAEGLRTAAGWLHPVSEVSSAALLGGAVTGMLLGHWYLTAPTMSIAPLWRLTLFFGLAAAFRLAVSAVGLWLAWDHLAGQTHWIWLSLRWTAGVVGPLAVFVMVWRILGYRNTQSATGVLFVGVILSFIGEMTASLLYRDLLMPV